MLTSFWIINNSKKKEIRLQQEFQDFLDKHTSFKMTLEEVVFILGRNGMNMVDLSQDFDETTTAANFKSFIQELVSLSGQLLANLTDVLYCFFKSRETIGKVDEIIDVKKHAESKKLANMFVKADREYMISKKNMSETPMVAARSGDVSLKINDLDEKILMKQESHKKKPYTVTKGKQESDIELVKVDEENKCLRNEKKMLDKKFEVLMKVRERRRFENTALVEILALILEGGTQDVAKLPNAKHRNMVMKIQQLLTKYPTESNKTFSCSRISNKSVEESSAGTEVEKELPAKVEEEALAKVEEEALAKVEEEALAKVEEEALAKVEEEALTEVKEEALAEVKKEALAEVKKEALAEEQKTVRVRLFQTGSHSALQEPHLVPIPSGTQLLPLSALQVVD